MCWIIIPTEPYHSISLNGFDQIAKDVADYEEAVAEELLS